jgi:hypothetical protein
MSAEQNHAAPLLPDSFRARLQRYRRTLLSRKGLEALCVALLLAGAAFAAQFGLDRLLDMPPWGRGLLFFLGVILALGLFFGQVLRWAFRQRNDATTARWIAGRDLVLGDRLMGMLELSANSEELARSPELVRAAISQGEAALRQSGLEHTLPRSRHRGLAVAALCAGLAAGALAAFEPEAAGNAAQRWLRPLAAIPRYTFTRLKPHQTELYVARLEPTAVELALADETRRQPSLATLKAAGEQLRAARTSGGYRFELQGLDSEVSGRLRVGDAIERWTIRPLARPELDSIEAEIALPDYLELPAALLRDVRAGSLLVVEGARIQLQANFTRALRSATSSAGAVELSAAGLRSEPLVVTAPNSIEIAWVDEHGLSGPAPFRLALHPRPDGRPSATLVGIEEGQVLLEDAALSFSVRCADDFGVREVGLVWEGSGDLERGLERAQGEKPLGDGAPDARDLEVEGSLHPRLQGIDPQELTLRAYAIDSLPGRERSYSTPVRVTVLTAADHMLWVTRQLAAWHDETVEVRDIEQGLLRTNEQLLAESEERLASPEVQRTLVAQAAAERANGRRLAGLVHKGQRLLAEAARNEEFNSNTLDDWAASLAVLARLSAERMPSVAEQLAEAAGARPSAGAAAGAPAGSTPAGPVAQAPTEPSGASREGPENAAQSAPPAQGANASQPTPSIASGAAPSASGEPANPGAPRLTLASNTAGAPEPAAPGAAQEEAPENPYGPRQSAVARAVAEQRALMEEFQQVAGQITAVLANLEGSTFVKRLTNLARVELGLADDFDATLAETLGAKEIPKTSAEPMAAAIELQGVTAERAAEVREDLALYVERMGARGSDVSNFKKVYDQMGQVGVTREMGTIQELAKISRSGEAIAAAENLADDLDRWAEMLVGPG